MNKVEKQTPNNIKKLRSKFHLTQQQLADKIDRARPFLGGVEVGQYILTDDMKTRIADALGIDESEIVIY